MYEVIPLVAGVLIALLLPRLAASRGRRLAYGGGLSALAGVAATIIAGEEWFFVIVDTAAVLVAMGVTMAILAAWPARRATSLP